MSGSTVVPSPSTSSAGGGAAPTEVGSVYVHAPFCARRCGYCDFAVTVRRSGGPETWLEALGAELASLEAEGLFALASRLETLYVGGGTPSLLGPRAMEGLKALLGSERLDSPTLEWTAEANPESFTTDVAEGWVAAGVNRLSLGLQTFDEDALRWMGRLHGAEGPVRALAAARSAGIANVSVDLIFGLPARLERSWDDDLQRAIALDVPHVSLYGLTIEAGTPLGRAVQEGRETAVDEDTYRREYLRAVEALTDAGFRHYEVSNFARPGFEARHNTIYWNGEPYLGLGNGAHSYAPPVRRWNVRDWEDYRRRVMAGGAGEDAREVVDGASASLERVWLGLRTREGIPIPGAESREAAVARRWVEAGWAVEEGERLRLTTEGWLLLDELAVDLAG